MIKLIGISGRMGSGKDTVAKSLQYHCSPFHRDMEEPFRVTDNYEYPGNWRTKRFAGKLKEIASMFLGVPVGLLEDRTFKERPLPQWWDVHQYKAISGGTSVLPKYDGEVSMRSMTVREFLQKLGTDAIRNHLHENAWVNALFADYDKTQKWLIPDTRFPNEAAAVKAHGGIVIRVNRPQEYHPDYVPHASETALDNWDFDYVIDNTGSMDELLEKTVTLLKLIKDDSFSTKT